MSERKVQIGNDYMLMFFQIIISFFNSHFLSFSTLTLCHFEMRFRLWASDFRRIFAPASLIRPAPAESPRAGRQQGQVVERCDISNLPFFFYFI